MIGASRVVPTNAVAPVQPVVVKDLVILSLLPMKISKEEVPACWNAGWNGLDPTITTIKTRVITPALPTDH